MQACARSETLESSVLGGGSSVTFVALEVARLHHGILFVTDRA